MAQVTRTEMHDAIKRILGGQDPGTTLLDFYVNFGYFHVCQMIQFETLHQESGIVAGIGAHTNGVSAQALGLKFLVNVTDKITMIYTPLPAFAMLDPDAEGPPTRWTRKGALIQWWPKQLAPTTFSFGWTGEPVKISGTVTTTVIPSAWDYVIICFAVSQALSDRNEEQRATYWMQRGERLMSVLYTSEDPSGVVEPVHFVRDLDELTTFRE